MEEAIDHNNMENANETRIQTPLGFTIFFPVHSRP